MNMKRKLLYLLLSLAVLTIWGYGNYYGQYAKSNFSSVSVRMQEASITKQDILTALVNEEIKGTKDIPEVTAWKQLEDLSFEYPELATTASLSVIEFWGDMTQIMPIKLVIGSIMTSEDDTGCIIDENAAYRLFRTREAVGRVLTYQSQSYCIRGVIQAKEEVVILPITVDENHYSNLELVYDNKESGKQYVLDFMQLNGLGEDYAIVEGCYYAKLIQMSSILPLWVLGIFLLYKLFSEGRKMRMGSLQKQTQKLEDIKIQKESLMIYLKRKRLLDKIVFSIIFTFTVFLLLRLMTEFMIVLPERCIPTRWSDFSFYTKRFNEFREQLLTMKYISPVTKNILMFQAIKRCAIFNLIASVATMILVTHRKVKMA